MENVGIEGTVAYYDGQFKIGIGMCLMENYSDSPNNEYLRHCLVESEYLRRQDMNSKSGEEQKKKGQYARRSPNFDSKSGAEQKKVITSVEVLISTQNWIRSKKRSK